MAVDRAQLFGRLGAVLTGAERLPRHPTWRFAFLSYLTTDPLFVALQYGVQDGVALTGCTSTWSGSANGDPKEVAKALDLAIDQKLDGVAAPLLDDDALEGAVTRAALAGLPVVGLGARTTLDVRVPYVGLRPEPAAFAIAARLAASVRSGAVAVFAGERELVAVRPLADALVASFGRHRLEATLVRTGRDVYAQLDLVGRYLTAHGDVRAAVALDTGSTEGLTLWLRKLPPTARAPVAAGWGVVPATLKLVADRRLAFTVDEQPYEQGFMAALQLFLTRVSGGLLQPADVHTDPIFVTRANVRRYLDTKSRFEGSSSRQHYPVG
jgi:simple sugar transport system substrate-binding protein